MNECEWVKLGGARIPLSCGYCTLRIVSTAGLYPAENLLLRKSVLRFEEVICERKGWSRKECSRQGGDE